MNLSGIAPQGLRARILLTVGLTTTVIMMLMSWSMLYSWRESLVSQEKANAQAVSRAFSVAVIDALIFADQDLYQSEGFLGNYVDLFMAQNSRLRAITVLDPMGSVLARSWSRTDPPWVTGSLEELLHIDRPLTTITRTPEGPWVLETVLPMSTGERGWGVLVLAVEADSIRGQIRRNFILLASFSVAVTSGMLLLLWLMLGRLLRSLRALVRAMDTVDFTARPIPALPYRHDEIGNLYKHFHHMQQRVEQSRDELLKAQHQVWHAERLAAIGRLASGLAHEINNPLNGIRNCIYAIRGIDPCLGCHREASWIRPQAAGRYGPGQHQRTGRGGAASGRFQPGAQESHTDPGSHHEPDAQRGRRGPGEGFHPGGDLVPG